MYTVRIIIQVKNSRRQFKAFVRPEFAINTSSHAYRYATMDDAQTAADKIAERYQDNGHTIIGCDFFTGERLSRYYFPHNAILALRFTHR